MVTGNGYLNNYLNSSIKNVISNTGKVPAIDKNVPQASLNTGSKVNAEFGDILNNKIAEKTLLFSKHAELRLQSRNINLSSSQMKRIIEGVNKAGTKGVKDSLILLDDIALIVNIKKRTVITAASKNELKENVFTNIDGAVIV